MYRAACNRKLLTLLQTLSTPPRTLTTGAAPPPVPRAATTPPSVPRTATTFPPVPPGANPGMNAETFKALLRPPGPKHQQRRYTLRWDWHLRNFLTALVPPAVLYAFLSLVGYVFEKEGKEHTKLLEVADLPFQGNVKASDASVPVLKADAQAADAAAEGVAGGLVAALERRLSVLEERINRMHMHEEQRARLRDAEGADGAGGDADADAVLAARTVARKLVRTGGTEGAKGSQLAQKR